MQRSQETLFSQPLHYVWTWRSIIIFQRRRKCAFCYQQHVEYKSEDTGVDVLNMLKKDSSYCQWTIYSNVYLTLSEILLSMTFSEWNDIAVWLMCMNCGPLIAQRQDRLITSPACLTCFTRAHDEPRGAAMTPLCQCCCQSLSCRLLPV